MTGTESDPIVFKPKNYLQAVIDGGLIIGNGTGIGAFTVYRGLRVFCTSPEYRGLWTDLFTREYYRANAFSILAPNCKIINNIIHDGGIGGMAYGDADGLVWYGNVTYNGGVANERGGQPSIYMHGNNKEIRHNVFGASFYHEVQIYTTGSVINDFDITENVMFLKSNAQVGGENGIANNIAFNFNHLVGTSVSFLIGYNYKYNGIAQIKGNRTYTKNHTAIFYWDNVEMCDNVIVQGENSANHAFYFADDREPSEYNWNFHDNKYHYLGATPSQAFKVEYGEDYFGGDGWGSWAEWNAAGYDTVGSTYSEVKPSVNETFVYPNEYPDADDKRMGIVVIWNWEEEETVEVDLTDLGLEVGQTYRWRQAQDPLVDVDTWECAGNSYTFAMTGHTVAKPIGFDEELIPTQFPTFGCFIIEKV